MKNIILTIIILCIFGCGVDVTDPQAGYFDKSTDNSVNIDNSIHYSESIKDTVIIKDTVERKIVDTIIDTLKQIKVDTVIKHKVDTLKQIKVDTIKSVKLDTVTQIKIDTIRQTILDTIYEKITDTVYSKVIDTLYKSFEEEPRDTTITLSEEIDGVLYTKSYEGIVYKNVFYDTTKYKFNEQITVGGYRNGWVNIYQREGTRHEDIDAIDKCGILSEPTAGTIAWTGDTFTKIKRFNNWRVFGPKDALIIRDYLEKFIVDNKKIFLTWVDCDTDKCKTTPGQYANEAAIATKESNSLIAKGYDVQMHYMCAYELK